MAELSNLGRYQLRRVLGKGAMGVVYDGYDPTIDRRVAVKIILKNHGIDEAMARAYSARFVREARAAGRINRSNIEQTLGNRPNGTTTPADAESKSAPQADRQTLTGGNICMLPRFERS